MVSFWGVGLGAGLLLSGPGGLGFSGFWAGMSIGAGLIAGVNLNATYAKSIMLLTWVSARGC